MMISIAEENLTALVALEGLYGRTVEIQTDDNEHITGAVTGVALDGLNVDDRGYDWSQLYRLRVTG